MNTNLNKVMDMIDDLEPNEKRIIYRKLKDEIRVKMNEILDTVNERLGDESIDISEITKEVDEIRGLNHGTH